MLKKMRRIHFNFPIFFDGSVIDVETTQKGNITCFGFISGSRGSSCISDRYDLSDMRPYIIKILGSLKQPFYAFNKKFEETCFKKLDLDVSIANEIQLFPFEKKLRAIQITHNIDPFNGDGYKCIIAWENYIRTKNVSFLNKILLHNKTCLIQELMLVLASQIRDKL